MLAGSPPRWWSIPVGHPTTIVDAGCGPIAVGIGVPITHGAGRRFITAAGFAIVAWAGAGHRTGFGGHPGLAGVTLIAIAGGLPCRRERATPLESA